MDEAGKRQLLRYFPLLLVIAETVAYLSNDMYLPALTQISRDFATTHGMVQLSLTTWFLGLATTHPILGPVSDKIGRRPIVLGGCALFVITADLCALAHNVETLIIVRYFQGASVCAIVVAGYAAIHELHEQKQAIHILAWMSSITVLAPAFGPLLGGLVLMITHWRNIFALLAVVNLLVLLLLYYSMPESVPFHQAKNARFRTVFSSYKKILTNTDFLQNAVAFGFLFSGSVAWVVAGPFIVMREFNYNVIVFGLVQVLIFGCFVLTSRSVKAITNYFNLKGLIRTGLSALLTGVVLACAVSNAFPDYFIPMVLALMIYMAGQGLVFATLNRLAIESSVDEPMGARTAMFFTMMSGFGALGTIFVSLFYNTHLYSLAYILTTVVVIAALLKYKVFFGSITE